MPDASATFAGVTRAVQGSYNVSWGTSPGVARLTVGPNFGQIGNIGALTFRFREQSFTLRDAIVIDPTTVGGIGQAPVFDFTALDRRWKWQYCGRITGDFNKETKQGQLLREASHRALVLKCLAALGEPLARYVGIGNIPDHLRPRVVWEAERPIDALNKLLDDISCVLVFDPVQDRVGFAKIGEGSTPPGNLNNRVIARDRGFVLKPPPDEIIAIGGPVLFELKLVLGDPQALEVDGSYKSIFDVSYKPPEGWTQILPGEFDEIETSYTDPITGEEAFHRDLAAASVWRCFKIEGVKTRGNWTPEALRNSQLAPSSLKDLGPYLSTILKRDLIEGERTPAFAVGTFADERIGFEKKTGRWPGNVSINEQHGVVTFDKPCFFYADNGDVVPPSMSLHVALNLSKDGVPIRYEYRLPTGANGGAGAYIERHDEAVREIREAFENADNRNKIDEQLSYYANAAIPRFQGAIAENITYGGMQMGLALDGALRSITWSFGAYGAPRTQASWNTEESPYIVAWENRPEARQLRVSEAALRRFAANKAIEASRTSVLTVNKA